MLPQRGLAERRQPAPPRRMKSARLVVPLIFALALIGSLLAWSGLTLRDLAASLRAIPAGAAVGIVASTGLFVVLSSLKWRLVMSHVSAADSDMPNTSFSLYVTALGGALALVIPPHAAMVLSRSLGTKAHGNGSAIVSGAASAYEQLFDAIPLATMALTALGAIILKASLAGWLAIAAALNAAALVAVVLLFRGRFWSLARFMPLPRRSRASVLQKLDWFTTPAAETLLGPSFVSTLFAISLARYGVIFLRTWIVMNAVALPISGFQFAKAYGLARLSTLLSVTPGELGINEWTWTGVLSWMGCRPEDAVRFGLTNRLCNMASLMIVFGLIWCGFTVLRIASQRSQRRPEGATS
jgi:uncharacterized membrane protein YbhN (UPF0104 family)